MPGMARFRGRATRPDSLVSAASLRQSRYVRWMIRTIGVERVVKVVGLLELPVVALVGALVRRVRRDPNLVALGAPLDRFADNSAYLFLHLAHQRNGLRPVWISGSRAVVADLRRRGLPAELRWSLGGVRACLRAGSFAYSGYRSDVNQLLAPGAVAVSLWHGVGIKRVGGGVVSAGERRQTLLGRLAEAGREQPADYFLSSTSYVTHTIFSPAFGTPPEHCWELGYPRNDHLVAGEGAPEALVTADLAGRLSSAEKVVGVFLTWRGDRVDDVIDEQLLLRLAEVCRRHGAVVAYKAHYNMQPTAVLAENCVLLPPTADLNAYLGHCDVLVTDYSSVAADFLLMRRPAVYFMPDLEEYADRPGFYFPPERLPGVLTRDPSTMLEAVEEAVSRPSEPWSGWSGEDEAFLEMLWGEDRGGASAGVAAALATAMASRRSQGRRTAPFAQRGSASSLSKAPK